MDQICQNFMASHNQNIIDAALTQTSLLLQSIHRYHDEILQLAGVGPELEEADSVMRSVRTVQQALEELLCSSMGESDEVTRMYKSQQFSFQQN
jgi:hypothetical protein